MAMPTSADMIVLEADLMFVGRSSRAPCERLLRQHGAVMGHDERAKVGQSLGALDRLLDQRACPE